LVVVFSCNHCPYVKAYEDRMVSIQRDYASRGVQLVAINSNDAEAYQYLPRSTAYLPPPDDLLALVEAAGFAGVERRTFTAGAVQLITGTRR